MGPFRIDENGTLADWVKWAFPDWDPSGLVKMGPFRIGENGTFPDWDTSELVKKGPFRVSENGTVPDWDTSGLVKMGPFRIGQNGTLPDWDASGLVKMAFPGRLKFTPETRFDTVSESIMLYELTRKGVIRPYIPSDSS